ncbi:MAG: type III pantothenate kinase, partial [Nitrospirae bacterium]|nr:type III pantothenate kinase [Nitrospirota bacterium]
VSSVVPYLNKPVIESLKSLCRKKPLVVSDKITSGLSFDVKQPGEIGADRIANAVAGFHHARKAVAVVDFGTATTITVVGRNMNFLGGAIMPGIHLMQKSLHRETAKLPIVPLKKNSRALGKDTASSITSGIIHGTAGAVETIIKNMEKELDFKLQLVLTGGNAKFMSSLLKRNYDLVPNLTFEGLRLIYLKNRKELQDHA